MEAVNVEVRRVEAGGGPRQAVSDLDADLSRARWLARLLDAQFNVAGIQFGLDAIVGLIPVAGDLATALAALYPLHVARKHDLGKAVQARMAMNVLVDFAAGAVPVLGDVLDVAYKANLKNLKLLEKAVEKRRGRGT